MLSKRFFDFLTPWSPKISKKLIFVFVFFITKLTTYFVYSVSKNNFKKREITIILRVVFWKLVWTYISTSPRKLYQHRSDWFCDIQSSNCQWVFYFVLGFRIRLGWDSLCISVFTAQGMSCSQSKNFRDMSNFIVNFKQRQSRPECIARADENLIFLCLEFFLKLNTKRFALL